MGYVDPNTVQDATAGQVLQAARLDADRTALEYIVRNKPHCDAYKTAAQTIATGGSGAALLFSNENYDVGGLHSTSSNTDRFTIPSGEDGKYDIATGGYFAVNSSNSRALDITKNGAALTPTRRDQIGGHATVAVYLHLALFAVPLVAGDIIRAVAYQDSGGNLGFADYWLTIKWCGL